MEEIVFPNQLRMLRRVRGRRMIELADLLGLTISALSKIEKGYRRLNEEQLKKVADFLDCPYEALFVTKDFSQPEVIKAWQEEQQARRQKNSGAGLRVLGAGLRYVRGQRKMSLMEIAKGAKLTLSVYHRIEMGQREVDEKTFENIARALGMSGEDLQIKIYELDSAGALDELKSSAGKRGLGLFKGGYNDLPMSRLMMRTGDSHEITVPISGTLKVDGILDMHSDTPVGSVLCPSTLAGDIGLYAIRLSGGETSALLPSSSVLVVSPTMPVRQMDWVIFQSDDCYGFARVMEVNDNLAQITVFGKNDVKQVKLDVLQRVVWIALI